MCGRITLTLPDLDQVAALLEAAVEPADAASYRPRWNAAPTDLHWMVEAKDAGARRLVPARWGFPGGTINARAETCAVRSAFREAFQSRRVVVPADGFYEWTGPDRDRRPIWFRPREGALLYLAGLATRLPDGTPGFVVLTTEAAGPIAEAHDRMPVLLPRSAVGDWLARPDSGLLVPAPVDFLTATPVSRRVNDVANDDPACLAPPEPAPVPPQLSLF